MGMQLDSINLYSKQRQKKRKNAKNGPIEYHRKIKLTSCARKLIATAFAYTSLLNLVDKNARQKAMICGLVLEGPSLCVAQCTSSIFFYLMHQ